MKKLILLFLILNFGCSSEVSKESEDSEKIYPIVINNSLHSIKNLDLKKYNLTTSDFYEDTITLNSILCLATENCSSELIIELLKIGANVNYECEEGSFEVITNLAFCKENGVQLTELFLKSGANINASDAEKDSFLSYAINYDNVELAEFLIDNGADLHTRDTNQKVGCLPIHGAESLEMLMLLKSRNFDLNQVCKNGKNLLHYLVKANNLKPAKYLVENNLVNKYKEDENGETPLDIAVQMDSKEFIALLQ